MLYEGEEVKVFIMAPGLKGVHHKGKDEEQTLTESLELFEEANGVTISQGN
jgi:hypothetical protein